MRTKEYLEREKNNIYYYKIVKKSIYDLYPLREDRRKTAEYINKYLFADVRCRELTRNYYGDISDVEFELQPDEVKHTIAFAVRAQILHVIMHDDSFVFANNIIASGENSYFENSKQLAGLIKTTNGSTINNIHEIIRNYKEDYPKTNLCEYLLDTCNKNYVYNHPYKLCLYEEWWLRAFNMAYQVFDEIRVHLHKPFKAKNIIKNINTGDATMDRAVTEMVTYMIDNYNFNITAEDKEKLTILSDLLKSLLESSNTVNEEPEEYKTVQEQLEKALIENEQLKVRLSESEYNPKTGLTCSQSTKGLMFLLNNVSSM